MNKTFWKPTKPDEQWLFEQIKNKHDNEFVRDIIARQTVIPVKRCHYILEKWTIKGIYDYGVTLDLGWLVEFNSLPE